MQIDDDANAGSAWFKIEYVLSSLLGEPTFKFRGKFRLGSATHMYKNCEGETQFFRASKMGSQALTKLSDLVTVSPDTKFRICFRGDDKWRRYCRTFKPDSMVAWDAPYGLAVSGSVSWDKLFRRNDDSKFHSADVAKGLYSQQIREAYLTVFDPAFVSKGSTSVASYIMAEQVKLNCDAPIEEQKEAEANEDPLAKALADKLTESFGKDGANESAASLSDAPESSLAGSLAKRIASGFGDAGAQDNAKGKDGDQFAGLLRAVEEGEEKREEKRRQDRLAALKKAETESTKKLEAGRKECEAKAPQLETEAYPLPVLLFSFPLDWSEERKDRARKRSNEREARERQKIRERNKRAEKRWEADYERWESQTLPRCLRPYEQAHKNRLSKIASSRKQILAEK